MSAAFDSVPVLGVPIHNVDMAGAVARVAEFVETSRRTGRTHQVVTVNTDFLVHAHRDPDVHTILQGADLAIADGMPVVWAAKAMGAELPGRVAGADLVPALAEAAALTGHRIMFFGGAGDTAAQAAALLRQQHPGADIVTATGVVSTDGEADDAQLRQIRDASPDILCVGLGHPKQERFIVRHADALGVPVSMGTGATFEFICGDTTRAPSWMQRTGLEWLHRMVNDPARLVRRYATDARVFGPAFARQMRTLGGRSANSEPASLPVPDPSAGSYELDLSGIGQISTGDATLLCSHATLARRRGDTVRLAEVTPRVASQLDRLRLRSLFQYFPQSSTEVSPS